MNEITIVNFEIEKIRKQLKSFSETGNLPDYISHDKFVSEYRNIKNLCNAWQYFLDDDEVFNAIIWSMHDSYIEFKRKQLKQEAISSYNVWFMRLERIKSNFKTLDSSFRLPAAHSGYPFDENPVCILAYEVSRAFHEKMGDYAPTKPNQINTFIISFVKNKNQKLLEALLSDIDELDRLIVDMRANQIEKDDKNVEGRILSEAFFKLDEFRVCLNSIQTILRQIS